MKTINEVARWVDCAVEEFGDPSEPICQIFARWMEPLESYDGEDVAAGVMDGTVYLRLGPAAMLPISIVPNGEEPGLDNEGRCHYGMERISVGLYALKPSLNVFGLIHAFVTLYDVPARVPWENRIVVVAGFNDRSALAVMGSRR
jgi:hypothetical protein